MLGNTKINTKSDVDNEETICLRCKDDNDIKKRLVGSILSHTKYMHIITLD